MHAFKLGASDRSPLLEEGVLDPDPGRILVGNVGIEIYGGQNAQISCSLPAQVN
jgi:hypothetical protein